MDNGLTEKSIFDLEIVGVNHRTLKVGEREKLAQIENEQEGFLNKLARESGSKELAVISTCNRFEVLAVGRRREVGIAEILQARLEIPVANDAFYSYRNGSAVKHFLRVAASLDSMVLGEAQILGQVKAAYQKAVQSGVAGKYLHYLFQYGFHLAKKIRSGTGIAGNAVSVSYIAVRLAEQIFETLSDRKILIIGTGEMGDLTALHFRSRGCGSIVIANRTVERAESLAARVNGRAVGLRDIDQELLEADIIVGSIRASEPLCDADRLRALGVSQPKFFIDLGLPRNFSPSIAKLDDIYLYNLDDLQGVAEQNQSLRKEAAIDAELLIEYGVAQFERWLKREVLAPDIIAMRSRVQEICDREIDEVLRLDLGVELRRELSRKLSHRIAQKLAHEATEKMTEHLSREDEELAESFLQNSLEVEE